MQNAARTMEAISLITAEIALHVNDIFIGMAKAPSPQVMIDAAVNLASIWSSVAAVYTATSNVEYDRKSLELSNSAKAEKAESKAKKAEYQAKKAENIINEFFKFQAALRTIIEALRWFAKFQAVNQSKFTEYIDLLARTDKKIEQKVLGELKQDTVRFGGADWVIEGSLRLREDSRKQFLDQLVSSPELAGDYVQQNYACSAERFISIDNFLPWIATAAGLNLNRFVDEALLTDFFNYIVRHVEKLGHEYASSLNFSIKCISAANCSAKLEINGLAEKYDSSVATLHGLWQLLRKIDVDILSQPAEKLRLIQVEGAGERTGVFKRIAELFPLVLQNSENYIVGAAESDFNLLAKIHDVDSWEAANQFRIQELEKEFLKKIEPADELVGLIRRLISPDKTTCLRKLIPEVLEGAVPELLL